MRFSASCLSAIVLLAASTAAHATDIYVDGLGGNDASTTGAKTAPVLHFWRAMQLVHPGDTIHLLPTATYLGLSISHGGTAGLPITVTGDGVAPLLTKVTSDTTAATNLSEYSKGIYVYNNAQYVNISNLDVKGTGTAIFLAKGSNHIGILNNVLHDSGQAGLQVVGSDYVTITGNTVFNNAWDTTSGSFGSGISILNSVDTDTNTTQPKIIISNNTVYHNYNLPRTPGEACAPTGDKCTSYNSNSDGNGIILDRNSGRTSTTATTATQTPYNGRILISGNVTYNNGGRGIHIYLTDHVTVTNNTAYKNNQDLYEASWQPGEIMAVNSNDDTFYNNLVYPSPLLSGQTVGGHYGLSIEYCVAGTAPITLDYNMSYNDGNLSAYKMFTGSGASTNTVPVTLGGHNFWANPFFIAGNTDPAVANFNLNLNSPALNAGSAVTAVLTDTVGKLLAVAPQAVQIGALAPPPVDSPQVSLAAATLTVKPGTTTTVQGVRVVDPWAANQTAQMSVTLQANGGKLSMPGAQWNNTNHIKLYGSLAQINAGLAALQYTASAQAGSDSVVFTPWNQKGYSGTGTLAVTISAN